MQQPIWNFEQEPFEGPYDETSVNLRAYFDRMDDGKMREYSKDWTDAQVLAWDENFKDDETLMIACCERDIELEEYRRVLEQAMAYRDRVRGEPNEEPVRIPIMDVFDLHTVPPRDAKAVVEEYLMEAHRLGLKALRIIHGRGIGVQRDMVRAVLARTPFVDSYSDAPAEAGGWGATLVTLR